MEEPMICGLCGGKSFEDLGEGKLKCRYCGMVYHTEQTTLTKEKIELMDCLSNAEHYLRIDPPRFDEAEDSFEAVIQKYPTASGGYWGKLRAKYGIKYEIDVDGQNVPSCYKSEYIDYSKDSNYLNAIKYAESDELRERYERECKTYAKVAEIWREKTKDFVFDIFISFKASDENGGETSDVREMQNLYTYLTELGYKVFFSPVTLNKKGIIGAASEPYIFRALESAKAMIVYGSKSEYFASTWVKNEWSRYLRMASKGEKAENSLLVVHNNVNISDLPRRLSRIQAIDITARTAYGNIEDGLEQIMKSTKRDIECKSVLERKSIKSGSVGKKASDMSSIATRKNHNNNAVVTRELGSSVINYTLDDQKYFDAGYGFLKNGLFKEAEDIFNECLDKKKENGKAWLGLLCARLGRKNLYDQITEDKCDAHKFDFLTNSNINNQNLESVKNGIEYADSKLMAENLLLVMAKFMMICFDAGDMDMARDLYEYCIGYDSEVVERISELMLDNLQLIVKNKCGEDEMNWIMNILASCGQKDIDWYINTSLSCGYILRNNGYFDKAREMFAYTLKCEENNYRALNGILLCDMQSKVKSVGDWSAFDIERFEDILQYSPDQRSQCIMIYDFIDLCTACMEESKNNAVVIDGIFAQIIKYLPDSENEKLASKVLIFAKECVEGGAYDIGEKYVKVYVDLAKKVNESMINHKVYWLLLLIKLECKGERDFVQCRRFSKDMPEFRQLKMSCATDMDTYRHYTDLAEQNIKNTAGYELSERQSAQIKGKRRIKSIIYGVSIGLGVIFALIGAAYWLIYGDYAAMYMHNVVYAMFALSLVCFAVGFVLHLYVDKWLDKSKKNKQSKGKNKSRIGDK